MNICMRRAALQVMASALLMAGLAGVPASASSFIPEGSKYTPDSEEQERRDGILLRGEKGEIAGIRYYIWQDGQAYYARWRIFCSVDAMSDRRSCALMKDDLYVSVGSRGVEALLIGEKHFPGTSVLIRIDSGKPIESSAKGWFGRDAAKLIELASKSTNLRTRYTKWPSKAWVDSETEATGLAEAVKMATWMVNQGS